MENLNFHKNYHNLFLFFIYNKHKTFNIKNKKISYVFWLFSKNSGEIEKLSEFWVCSMLFLHGTQMLNKNVYCTTMCTFATFLN